MDDDFLKDIKDRIKKTPGLNIPGLAAQLEKSESQTYRILKGKSPYKSYYTKMIREYLDSGLMLGRDARAIEVLDLVDLKDADSLTSGQDILSRLTLPRIMLPENKDIDAIKIIHVPGDHCAPDYDLGDYIFVDTADRVPEPPGIFLLWTGLGYKLQCCDHVLGSDPIKIRLSSSNKAPEYVPVQLPLNAAQIKGRVIGKIVLAKH